MLPLLAAIWLALRAGPWLLSLLRRASLSKRAALGSVAAFLRLPGPPVGRLLPVLPRRPLALLLLLCRLRWLGLRACLPALLRHRLWRRRRLAGLLLALLALGRALPLLLPLLRRTGARLLLLRLLGRCLLGSHCATAGRAATGAGQARGAAVHGC